MGTRNRTAIELIGACTLKGILYGAVSGTATGLLLFVIGAAFGLPLGAAFGALFGAVNGIVLWDLETRSGLRQNDPRQAGIRRAACMITSFILLVIISAASYFVNAILVVYCLFAIPGVLISAVVLANWVTKQYPTMQIQFYAAHAVDDQSGVWPPAPRVDGGFTNW